MNDQLVESIDALLPQTQCTRCGYPDCRAYASAIAHAQAPINRCPPGGQAGIERLARLLSAAELPLDPSVGLETPRATAIIDETHCIGCTLCIKACPVDAIIGSAKRMHTVLTTVCNGCELCLPPCPVDCIEMLPVESLAARGNSQAQRLLAQTPDELAPFWRRRYHARNARLARDSEKQKRGTRVAANAGESVQPHAADGADAKKAAIVAAALERARIRRSNASASTETGAGVATRDSRNK